MAAKNQSFEAAMEKLEKIVVRLESGEEPLDSSLKLFEEGSALASFCYQKLEHAEQKIKQISELEKEGSQKE